MGSVLSCYSDGGNSLRSKREELEAGGKNIIQNHDFSSGKAEPWVYMSGYGSVCNSIDSCRRPEGGVGVSAETGDYFVKVTNRVAEWQGLEQDITTSVSVGSLYQVSAVVRVFGNMQELTQVEATLRLEWLSSRPNTYSSIGCILVGDRSWEKFQGFTFSLSSKPNRVTFYLEGPPVGVDLLVDSVTITQIERCVPGRNDNIIQNPEFNDGLNHWTGFMCKIESNCEGGGAKATRRLRRRSGIWQDISARLERKAVYEITAQVQILGNNVIDADVKANLWVGRPNLREREKLVIAKAWATKENWVQLKGKFIINYPQLTAAICIAGPHRGTDILIKHVTVKHVQAISQLDAPTRPLIQHGSYGVNIVENSIKNLSLHEEESYNVDDNTTEGWIPFCGCTLDVGIGSPRVLPPMARESLRMQKPLSGYYILVSNRSQISSGPAQIITEKLKLYVTYQISAWIRIGPGVKGKENVYVSLEIDNQQINGGQVEANAAEWHEIGGSFRIEKEPTKVMVYVHGPSPNVNFMVAGFQIFSVDWQTRNTYLKEKTEKIRMRDVILKFTGEEACRLTQARVKVVQRENKFSFGSCVTETDIYNEDYTKFFVENFDWAVFKEELTWAHTEPEQDEFNYDDANELLKFCEHHGMKMRGHCIFSASKENIQPWVQNLDRDKLMTAIQNRLEALLTMYQEQFRHYDVHDEMLQRSFYPDKLGEVIQSYMFKKARELDNSAVLFLNEIYDQSECDEGSNFSPEKYINRVIQLQKEGAPIGGIGIKAHMNGPVGAIVCAALDKLGTLGLPIWFTELDVSSTNEFVRADDLEIMLRECFAHPAVDGIMLSQLWETFMSQSNNAHLVNADGAPNEAGKRYLDLRKEWSTNIEGVIDENGEFKFRGFHGTYNVELVVLKKLLTFEVQEGENEVFVEWS